MYGKKGKSLLPSKPTTEEEIGPDKVLAKNESTIYPIVFISKEINKPKNVLDEKVFAHITVKDKKGVVMSNVEQQLAVTWVTIGIEKPVDDNKPRIYYQKDPNSTSFRLSFDATITNETNTSVDLSFYNFHYRLFAEESTILEG